jgi:hypothetical protein
VEIHHGRRYQALVGSRSLHKFGNEGVSLLAVLSFHLLGDTYLSGGHLQLARAWLSTRYREEDSYETGNAKFLEINTPFSYILKE